MLDRRTMTALLAAAPFATPLQRLDLPDPRIQPLNTEGVVVFGISPDASVLVGHVEGERLTFLNAKTRFPISESAAIPEIGILDETAVAWSPDGTRIAFGLEAWLFLRDSDIFIADVETGEVTNFTPEGDEKEADSLMTVPDVQVDISPVWLDDDTILFARHGRRDLDELECTLCTLSVATALVEPYLNLAEFGIAFVGNNIWRLSDGTLVFMADFSGRDIRRGAVMVSPDGEVSDIHPGTLQTSNFISVNDTHLVSFDVQDFEWKYMSLDDSMEPTPLWDYFALPEGWRLVSDPVLGPEPDAMFVVLQNNNDVRSAQVFADGEHRQLGELEGAFERQTAHWAEGYILVAGQASWLLSQRGPGF